MAGERAECLKTNLPLPYIHISVICSLQKAVAEIDKALQTTHQDNLLLTILANQIEDVLHPIGDPKLDDISPEYPAAP